MIVTSELITNTDGLFENCADTSDLQPGSSKVLGFTSGSHKATVVQQVTLCPGYLTKVQNHPLRLISDLEWSTLAARLAIAQQRGLNLGVPIQTQYALAHNILHEVRRS